MAVAGEATFSSLWRQLTKSYPIWHQNTFFLTLPLRTCVKGGGYFFDAPSLHEAVAGGLGAASAASGSRTAPLASHEVEGEEQKHVTKH
eukprot:1485629-Amphidinium_carterae.1